MNTAEPLDYPYLRAWNVILGYTPGLNTTAARREAAPPTAIFRKDPSRGDSGWITLADIEKPELAERVREIARERFGATE